MFNNLVLSGASMKIVTLLGAYTYLHEKKILDKVINFCGCSAGALISFAAVSGLQPYRLKQILIDGIKTYLDTATNIDTILNIYTTMGIDDASVILSVITKIFSERFHVSDMTFLELAKATGKNLIVTVSNVSKGKVEYWSVDTMPNLSVTLALKASIALPIIFQPVIYNDNIYCDGGIFDFFPLQSIPHAAIQTTIGICLDDFNTELNNKHDINKQDFNLLNYIVMLIKSLVNKHNDISTKYITDNDKNYIIKIPDLHNVFTGINYETLKFHMDDETFVKLWDYGYSFTESYLSSKLFNETI